MDYHADAKKIFSYTADKSGWKGQSEEEFGTTLS